jgi:hypothetical protein
VSQYTRKNYAPVRWKALVELGEERRAIQEGLYYGHPLSWQFCAALETADSD